MGSKTENQSAGGVRVYRYLTDQTIKTGRTGITGKPRGGAGFRRKCVPSWAVMGLAGFQFFRLPVFPPGPLRYAGRLQ